MYKQICVVQTRVIQGSTVLVISHWMVAQRTVLVPIQIIFSDFWKPFKVKAWKTRSLSNFFYFQF